MTWTSSRQDPYRFLEDRFACAQACTECARMCALRAGVRAPDGTADGEADRLRRTGIRCAEVCDATCRAVTEGPDRDADGLLVQLEWCRTVCLDCARAFEARPGAEPGAAACRACAAACTDFMAALG
ncbi:ferredoxin [Streptomyces sp. NPDC008092]|uniref:ferredoxin n=1 Tax=Streptomyces sp. NPDC008092 TaxID=3364808 RepID=UPI0036E51894